MGNASSTSSGNKSISPRPRQSSTSPAPSPGNPHPSLRYKKKSLELPDLASLALTSTRGRVQPPEKTPSIPIPQSAVVESAVPGEQGRVRPRNRDEEYDDKSSDQDLLGEGDPRDARAYPPPPRERREREREGRERDHHRDRDRDRERDRAQRSRNRRIQEMYDESQAPINAHPPMLLEPFIPETVYSTIPIALSKAQHHDGPPELVPVKITWRGGGKNVLLARAGDDDWKGRLAMTQDSSNPSNYHATVSLPPGTHHIRFLIDDTWRVADDLPTAVDDQGSLANYVAVPINYSPPVVSSIPASVSKPRGTGQSFWSAASSTEDDDSQPSQPEPEPAPTTNTTGGAEKAQKQSHPQAVWTNVLPPELIEAAHEEEMYLAASEGHAHSPHHGHGHGHTRVAGFVPAPNIPPAPGLPRHLDKLILNARPVIAAAPGGAASSAGRKSGSSNGGSGNGGAGDGGAGNNNPGRGKGRERERERERENRDRERREREREGGGRETREGWRDDRERRRDRDRGERDHHNRERRNPPPPPPPSEAGTADPEPSEAPPAALSPASPTPTSPTLASPAPGSSAPGTPNPNTGAADAAAVSPLPPSFFPSSPLVSTLSPVYSSSTPTSTTSAPTPTPTRPLTLSIDPEAGLPALTDDASVLPVPSHVVLHHLSTSAIKNGVLAVGNTTRYRKKFLTTIYYKPT